MPTNKGRKQQNLAYHSTHEDAKANASGQRGSDSDHCGQSMDIRTHARELKSHRSAEKADA